MKKRKRKERGPISISFALSIDLTRPAKFIVAMDELDVDGHLLEWQHVPLAERRKRDGGESESENGGLETRERKCNGKR